MRAGQLVYGTDDRLDHLARETRRTPEKRPEPPILPEPKPEPDGEGLPGSRADRFAGGGLRRRRCGRRGGELAGGEYLAVCRDDLARFSRSASVWRAIDRALHALGQLDVLQLDDRDLDAPVLGLDIEDLADVLGDRAGLRQQFTKRVAPDDGTRRGLGDLVDRGGTFSIASTETTSATRLERTEKAGKARWAVSIHIAPGGSATASAVLQAFRARPGPRLEPGMWAPPDG